MWNKITKKYQFYFSFILELKKKEKKNAWHKNISTMGRRKKKEEKIKRKLIKIAIGILHISHMLSSIYTLKYWLFLPSAWYPFITTWWLKWQCGHYLKPHLFKGDESFQNRLDRGYEKYCFKNGGDRFYWGMILNRDDICYP